MAGFVNGGSLGVRVRCAFGADITADPATWAWTDISPWWHVPDPVEIGWGRAEGAEQPEPSTLSLTLKNHDGRFTTDYPMSPYWPHVVTWTPIQYDIDLGDGAGWRNRFSGFVRRWPVAWPGRSDRAALARIEAVGELGRIGRGKPPTMSPLRRTILAAQRTAPLLAYWPLEDGQDSRAAASGLPHGAAMGVSGEVEFAAFDPSERFSVARYGTGLLPRLSGGSLTGTVRPGVSSPVQWTVQAGISPDSFDVPTRMVLLSWTTPGGTLVRWELANTGDPDYDTELVAYDAAGVPTTVIRDGTGFDGFFEWRITAQQVGGTVQVQLWISGLSQGDVTPGGSSPWTATVPGTLGRVGTVSANPNAIEIPDNAQVGIGHIQVWDTANAPVFDRRNAFDDPPNPWLAFHSEHADARAARLCAENGIPFTATPVADEFATPMGPQPDGTLPDLLADCERTDQGLLREDGFGLGYLPRGARYNAPVALTINGAARQLAAPFEPVGDDQRLRNRWTVKRRRGSSATAEDRASIRAQGEIEASVEVNLPFDAPLADHASFLLHRSTVREPRYPSLSLDLGVSRELAAAWCDVKPGSRVRVVNPPPQAPPGPIDQVVVGASERFQGRRSWKVTANVEPASPWIVGVWEDSELGRLDTGGSEVAAAASESDTSLSVATTIGPVWTIDPTDLPFDIDVGGEQMTVTNISGPSSPQTFTVIRGVNGVHKPHPAGTPVRLAQPMRWAL